MRVEPGRQVHDAAAVRDQWQQCLRQKEHALEMDVHQPVELRLGGIGDQCIIAVSGIVHEMVERFARPGFAQRCSQTTSKVGEAGNLAGVELQRHRLAAHALDFGDDSLCVFAAALIGEDDIAAVTGDVESGIAAETAAGAGNEGNLGHGQLLWCDHSDIAPTKSGLVARSSTFLA